MSYDKVKDAGRTPRLRLRGAPVPGRGGRALASERVIGSLVVGPEWLRKFAVTENVTQTVPVSHEEVRGNKDEPRR